MGWRMRNRDGSARLALIMVLVILAGFLLPVSPLLALLVAWAAYAAGKGLRGGEESLMHVLAVASALGVGYSIAKAIWLTLP